MLCGNLPSIAYKSYKFSDNLIRTKRAFNFPLIITNHKKALFCDLIDAVEHKDTPVTAVKNYIISAAVCGSCLLDQGFIPAGNKKRVHAVALWFDANDISVTEKLLQIDFR